MSTVSKTYISKKRYHGYPKYADSGVPWLGRVPIHWRVTPLKYGVDPDRRITYGIVQCGPDVEDGVPYIRPVDMDAERGVPKKQLRKTAPDIAAAYSRSTVQEGDLVVSIGPSFGKVMAIPAELAGANLTQGTARVAPDRGVVGRFLFWYLRSDAAHQAWDSYSAGATFRSLTLETLSECHFAWPPESDQLAIAAYLDRETAKIDALVAKKERLIELLQEKRTALITHAVTKGLDPSVPMKPSEAEWLGEIPAHWDVKRVKWVAKMESGHTPDKKVDAYWEDGTIPWVSLNDTQYMKDHDYIADTAYYTNEQGLANSSAHLLPERSVVFTRDATIGRCAITTRPMAVSQHVIAWVCRDEMVPEYLLRVFDVMIDELNRLTAGATLKTIGMPEVRTLVTPVPPRAEQEMIIEDVLTELSKVDRLVTRVRYAIETLGEFRTALISAAITGKIDVREEAA